MIKITAGDLIEKCGCKLLIGNKDEEINECFVDSRKITKGSCFFGIKGEKNNGSLFYKEAFDNGASICVISKIYDLDLNGYDDKTVLISKDVRKSLQKLAAYKRSLFKGDVIAVTGSVGKTTTRKLISSVLNKKYKVLETSGNENSQIGLPLTILRYKDEDIMLLELGMSEMGQIHNLSLIAKPTISVITNIHDSHIGNLGSKENILKAKLEILDGMESGMLILNKDDDLLNNITNIKKEIKLKYFSMIEESDMKASNIIGDVISSFDVKDINNIKVKGSISYIYNCLAAILVAKQLNIDNETIKEGINSFTNEKHRLEIINLDNNIILIDDCYNASYASIKSALEYLNKFKGRKIAVIADILELGNESKNIHYKLGKEVIKNNVDILITIGKYSKLIGKKAIKMGFNRYNIKHFKTEEKSREYINKIIKENDVILIKGSNGMNLIDLVQFLKEE